MGIIATFLAGFATLAFLGRGEPGGIYKAAGGVAKEQEGFTPRSGRAPSTLAPLLRAPREHSRNSMQDWILGGSTSSVRLGWPFRPRCSFMVSETDESRSRRAMPSRGAIRIG
jgi:hypothetical protein